MAAASDAAILVVRCGDSRREQVEAIQRGLSVSGTKVLGVILNQRRYVLPTSIYRRL
jgi:Mrp family chromosome partitioning ATPase